MLQLNELNSTLEKKKREIIDLSERIRDMELEIKRKRSDLDRESRKEKNPPF